MRPFLNLFDVAYLNRNHRLLGNDVIDWLKAQFGGFQRCTHCVFIVAPPLGSVIHVMEPLQTCHPSSGEGLIDQCLPVGEYRILHQIDGGEGISHWLNFSGPGSNDAVVAKICLGYYGEPSEKRTLLDWRGVRNAAPMSP